MLCVCVSTLSSECCKHVRVCVCAHTPLERLQTPCMPSTSPGREGHSKEHTEGGGGRGGRGRERRGGGEGRGEGEEEGEGGREEGEERVDSEGTLQKAIASNSVQLLSTN